MNMCHLWHFALREAHASGSLDTEGGLYLEAKSGLPLRKVRERWAKAAIAK